MLDDVRHACRMLIRQPTFALTTTAVLAVGVAGVVTLLSVFHELYLHSLPVPDSGRLVILNESAPQLHMDRLGISPPDFHAWRAENQTFDGMAFWHDVGSNLSLGDTVERVRVLAVTSDFFAVLGIRPTLGRCFSQGEDQPDGPKVVMLSCGLWERLCSREPDILGRALRLDSVPHTIIGVLPPGTSFPQAADLWVPLAVGPDQGGGAYYLSGCGRLKRGDTLDQARTDLTRIHKGMVDVRPANKLTVPRLTPIREYYMAQYRHVTVILLCVVGLVLLMACSNVTGMMLARGAPRMEDVAIRSWLGATRWCIMRQILVESLVLSALAGALGGLIARWIIAFLLARSAGSVAPWVRFTITPTLVGLCVLMVMLTAVLSGFVPALHMSGGCRRGCTSSGTRGRTTASRAQHRIMSAIVVGEVALAVTLLIGAGLLLKAFRAVQAQQPGFRVQNVLTYQMSLPAARYEDGSKRQQFFELHLARVRTLPGVEGASLISNAPLISSQGEAFTVEDDPQDPAKPGIPILTRAMLSDYFETMDVPLRAGRLFDKWDYHPGSEPCVIVNEAFVEHFWPGQDAIGKRIAKKGSSMWLRVVGVARDVRHQSLDQAPVPGVYVPYTWDRRLEMHAVVRTTRDPLLVCAAIRAVVHSQDPDMTIYDVKTMSERMHASTRIRRAYTWSFTVFAGIAAVMAVSGAYGVVAYSASRRRLEIGIRMAMGARTADIMSHVLRRGLMLIGSGLATGLIIACVLSHVLSAYLFGVRRVDLTVYATTSVLLALVTVPACMIPARRAANTDPLDALRCG